MFRPVSAATKLSWLLGRQKDGGERRARFYKFGGLHLGGGKELVFAHHFPPKGQHPAYATHQQHQGGGQAPLGQQHRAAGPGRRFCRPVGQG